MNTRIVFFGASVTAQDKNHHSNEVTGYVTYLQNICPEWVIERVAYGSSQYSNMGKHGFINTILKNPRIVFFEWHTTGESNLSLNFLNKQSRLLGELGITMVILVLPTLRHASDSNMQKYEILNQTNIPILDLRSILSMSDQEPILRDEVHTTPIGAKIYAEQIRKYLINLNIKVSSHKLNYRLHDLVPFSLASPGLLSREILINSNLRTGDSIKFASSGDCDLIFGITRGPLSPKLKIKDMATKESIIITLTDQWSYYNRRSTGMEMSLLSNREQEIEILEELPAYDILCPKLLEPEYASRKAVTPIQLELQLDSIFVSLHASLKIKIERSIK